MPPSWVGNWFESGVREGVNITLLELSHKGTCIRSRQQNQFIFKDRYTTTRVHHDVPYHRQLEHKEKKRRGKAYLRHVHNRPPY